MIIALGWNDTVKLHDFEPSARGYGDKMAPPPGALVDGDAFVVKYVLRKHVWASTGWYRLEALADLFPDGWTTDDLVKLQVGMSGQPDTEYSAASRSTSPLKYMSPSTASKTVPPCCCIVSAAGNGGAAGEKGASGWGG